MIAGRVRAAVKTFFDGRDPAETQACETEGAGWVVRPSAPFPLPRSLTMRQNTRVRAC